MNELCWIICSIALAGATGEAPVRATIERPSWVDRGDWMESPVRYRVVTSELWATPDRAREDALRGARELALSFAAESDPSARAVRALPIRVVQDELVENEYLEREDRSYGTMYRAHLLLALSPEKRQIVLAEWNRNVAQHRLVQLGAGIGFLLVCLSAWLGYLRLDDATRGYYTPWLVALALAVVVGSGAVVYTWVL